MRDVNRIEPFMAELTDLWKRKAPDQRFGQFMCNILGEVSFRSGNKDVFFIEDSEMMKYIREIPWLQNKEN